MNECPCSSGKMYQDCCEPLLAGSRKAETAEELLRARYSAHVKLEMDFVKDTTHPDQVSRYEPATAKSWAEKSEWDRLEVVDVEDGGPEDETANIEFVAHFRQKDKLKTHHELAHFKRYEGEWFFYDGQGVVPKQVVRQQPKVGRNEPCPCGSGKKYKKCCG
ncbi:MAG: YchJ family protein [Deltaproteobacteria bacterium]|nr:MAG: YchJ family protein [Deltaproteobacteria bacterium]